MPVWLPTEDTPIKEMGQHPTYGVSQALADRLHEAGVTTFGKFTDLSVHGLRSLKGFSYPETLELGIAWKRIKTIVNSTRAIKASQAAMKSSQAAMKSSQAALQKRNDASHHRPLP